MDTSTCWSMCLIGFLWLRPWLRSLWPPGLPGLSLRQSSVRSVHTALGPDFVTKRMWMFIVNSPSPIWMVLGEGCMVAMTYVHTYKDQKDQIERKKNKESYFFGMRNFMEHYFLICHVVQQNIKNIMRWLIQTLNEVTESIPSLNETMSCCCFKFSKSYPW